jgi:hypothetical protein
MMKAKAYLVHSIPGRIRLRVPERRGDCGFFDEIRRQLQGLDTVSRVETNPVTASVLVYHEGEISDLAIQSVGTDIGDLVEFVPHAPPVAQLLCMETEKVDRNIQDLTAGELDLGTLTSFGLLAMATAHLLSGQQLIIAVSLGWYAVELIRRSCDTRALPTAELAKESSWYAGVAWAPPRA